MPRVKEERPQLHCRCFVHARPCREWSWGRCARTGLGVGPGLPQARAVPPLDRCRPWPRRPFGSWPSNICVVLASGPCATNYGPRTPGHARCPSGGDTKSVGELGGNLAHVGGHLVGRRVEGRAEGLAATTEWRFGRHRWWPHARQGEEARLQMGED